MIKGLITILKYATYVFRHQWYVRIACFRCGLWKRGLLHDWSKWTPAEFFPYARFFGRTNPRTKSGYYKPTDTGDPAFERAWLHHAHNNDHHWQHWAIVTEDGFKCYPMPYDAIKEMICDWWGAGRAQKSELTVLEWYNINSKKMRFHTKTRQMLEWLLERYINA